MRVLLSGDLSRAENTHTGLSINNINSTESYWGTIRQLYWAPHRN